jgi:hypothetical protein
LCVLAMYEEVGGRKIKVNVTKNFLPNNDRSPAEPELVLMTEVLKNFSEKGQIIRASVSVFWGLQSSKDMALSPSLLRIRPSLSADFKVLIF